MRNMLLVLMFVSLGLQVWAKELSFDVSGMSCGSCSSHIEKKVKELDGVQSVSADHTTGKVTVILSDEKATPEIIKKAIVGAGYTVKE